MFNYICTMDAIFTLAEIRETAQSLWEQGKSYRVWAFYGGMGLGKTTFIHALCEVLGVKDAISSPTFAIVNEYVRDTALPIYHMDWYRLKNAEEAIRAGVEELLESGALCLVEWPEKAAGLLPADTFQVYLEGIDAATRRIRAHSGNTMPEKR